ncbi:uncharacterized protein FOMMEDRAFT_146526, partial [Fomitiporia mediterranea MF3/22]|uniref:uncharacterized protein n=1 Tax=Fomitiporia mediterranea (strain MF3/22) TaxID=694068 RepID=UPI00044075C8
MADDSPEQATSRNRVSFSTKVKLSAEDSDPEPEPSQIEKWKSKIFRRSSSDGSASGTGRYSQARSSSAHRESNNLVVDEEYEDDVEGEDVEGHQEMTEAEFRRRNLEKALNGGINECLRFQTGKRGKITKTGNKSDKHEVCLKFKRGYATCWFDEECRLFLKYLKALTKHFAEYHEKGNIPEQKELNER